MTLLLLRVDKLLAEQKFRVDENCSFLDGCPMNVLVNGSIPIVIALQHRQPRPLCSPQHAKTTQMIGADGGLIDNSATVPATADHDTNRVPSTQ